MFNIGTQELLIILLVVLLLFGAKRIPEVARALGKGMTDFRDAMAGVERELKGEPPVAHPAPRLIPPLPGTGQTPLDQPVPATDPGAVVASTGPDAPTPAPAPAPAPSAQPDGASAPTERTSAPAGRTDTPDHAPGPDPGTQG